MKQFTEIRMDARSENEEYARVAAASFISRMDPSLDELYDVRTAVSEAVTNCIIHAYREEEGVILLRVEIEENEIEIRVEDHGIGIPDVEKAMEPMYTTSEDGNRSGMGFSFMEAFMDSVRVDSSPGKGTVVTMKKKIRENKECLIQGNS